jgi:hypothetical protein
MSFARFAARYGRRAGLRLVAAGGVAIVACHAGPAVVTATPSTARDQPPAGSPQPTGAAARGTTWRIETREHVDLWLHGFAMLQTDSSLVPYYRLNYRSQVSDARRAMNVTSRLDANAATLARRLAENPGLVSAQFVALYFASWDDMRRACAQFVRDGGNVNRAWDRETVRMYATLATYFPTSPDREWLRLFVESLDDERTRFYQGWWQQQQSQRASVRGALDAQWRGGYGVAFNRFFHGTNQRTGAILLSLPLGGEGRSLDVGQRDNFITVTYPAPGEDPRDALYVVAHEAVGTVSNTVVRDHTSPNDQRTGETGRLSTLAAVRGGAMMLARVAPDLADGYRRMYLRLARQVPGADVTRQFEAIFPLPEAIRSALEHQIDLVLNGI